MKVWHASTRDPAEAQRWHAAFVAAEPQALAIVAPATGPLVSGTQALEVPVTQAQWGRLCAAGAELCWRAEVERVALSVVAEHAIDGVELTTTELDAMPERATARLDAPVARLLGDRATINTVTYRYEGSAWLRRTEVTA